MRKLIPLAFLILASISGTAQDQEVESDVESWISVAATKRFDFDLDISLEQQVRFLPYQQTFTEVGLNYKALKFLNIGTEVRIKFLKDGLTNYRIAALAGIEAGKKDFEIDYRFKVTSNFSKHDTPLVALRNKVALKYTIKKDWRLGTSVETFHKKEDNFFWIAKFRWMLALRYKITKMHLVTLFYGIERDGDLDLDDPVTLRHIFGTRYDIRW